MFKIDPKLMIDVDPKLLSLIENKYLLQYQNLIYNDNSNELMRKIQLVEQEISNYNKIKYRKEKFKKLFKNFE